MNKKITVIFFIFTFTINSCTKEVEIVIPTREPSLVVYSTLVPFTLPIPKSLSIEVSSTNQIFDTTTVSVEDAFVLLFINGLADTLWYNSETRNFPINASLDVNDELEVHVSKNNYKTISSTTTIPSKVVIEKTEVNPIAYFDDTGSVFSEVSITFTDIPNETNFYEIALTSTAFSFDNPSDYYELSTTENIITSQAYYPSIIRFDVPKPKYLLFNDQMISGTTKTINVYYTPPQIEDEHRFIAQHYITVHLRNVTKEYFLYRTTTLQHQYNRLNDILYGIGEPINVISNIQNGFGLFAGFNNDMITIQVESQIISN